MKNLNFAAYNSKIDLRGSFCNYDFFNMPFQKWISFVIPTDQKMIAFIFLKSQLVKTIAKNTATENDSNMF